VPASGACSAAEISRWLPAAPPAAKISFDMQDLAAWDNVLIDFLNKIETIAGERGMSIDRSTLPGGRGRAAARSGASRSPSTPAGRRVDPRQR
jgi:hypothetical protein